MQVTDVDTGGGQRVALQIDRLAIIGGFGNAERQSHERLEWVIWRRSTFVSLALAKQPWRAGVVILRALDRDATEQRV